MCGICGVFTFGSHEEVNPQRLTAMARTMVHRGPDDEGTYVNPDRKVGFGFRRLSIIDLSSGHQPMTNEDGSIWIVFNGEIYNHGELRQELEAKGHTYRTKADTESVIHAYEEWGMDCVQRLRGMFAFAIWDERQRKLFLARDRIGIKPLYYTSQSGNFLFGSEIKAILEWPGVRREVDTQALYDYLTLLATPAPSTLFHGIQKLPAGHAMAISEDGSHRTWRYWTPMPSDEGIRDASEAEVADRLRELLTESIRLRLMSDVPFGVFLSGGLDSSLNVALMSQMMDRPVDTYSVAIQGDARSDEREQARGVAQHFGANHHEVSITHQDFIESLPQIVHHQDEPLSDPVCVPLYHVSKLAKKNGTTVIQVGEGSDELFAGYADYALFERLQQRYFAPMGALPTWMLKPVAAAGAAVLPVRKADFLRKAASGEPAFWSGATALSELEKRRLLKDASASASTARIINERVAEFRSLRPNAPYLDQMIYLELQHRLPELLLMREDKMAMANSVETRVPYLDHELVTFALGIPPVLKNGNGQFKSILKKAARGVLPDYVVDRPKVGFCGSASNMVTGVIAAHAQKSVVGSGWLKEWLHVEQVEKIFAQHQSGAADNGMAIWLLLNLEAWHKHWIEQEPVLP